MHLACTVSAGTLMPLNKPNKTKGPCANLRPITLLNTIRKLISVAVLSRSSVQVSKFLGANQSGFRAGRSTADVVWALRWLAVKAMRYNWECHVLGIDMSKAFDTIDRSNWECHVLGIDNVQGIRQDR